MTKLSHSKQKVKNTKNTSTLKKNPEIRLQLRAFIMKTVLPDFLSPQSSMWSKVCGHPQSLL